MHRVLVLGAGGMLGHKLCQRLGSRAGFEVCATVRQPVEQYAKFNGIFDTVELIGGVDVLDPRSLEHTIRTVAPEFIVNCVGIVKQLREAHDRYLSVAINSLLPHRLSSLCESHDVRLIHLSTDCVFDGRRGSYTEDDPSDATDLYGKSKYLGETGPEQTRALTIRSSIIGRELQHPTHGLVEWFVSRRGGAAKGFDRAIYSGLTTIEMANVIARVIEKTPNLCGTHHVAGPSIRKYILLDLIRRIFALDIDLERDDDFVCDRSLLMGPFAEATGYEPPSWEAMIEEMHGDPTPYDGWLDQA